MAWEIALIVVFVPFGAFVLLMALMRWGELFPRFGRWLDLQLRRTRLTRVLVDSRRREGGA